MIWAVLRRLGQMVLVMLGISVLAFLIFFATPGADPSVRIAGRNAAPETLAKVRHDFGLDRPLPEQYGRLMVRLFITRDLTSFVNRGQKIVPTLMAAIPATLSLVLGAAVLWLAGGLVIGVISCAWRGSVLDRTLMTLSLIGLSMPVFWLGEVANLLTQKLWHDSWLFGWVPALGYVPLSEDPWSWFKGLVIPWVTLAILYIGLYARVLRSTLIDTLQEDFVRMARAKGIGGRRVLLNHALRASLASFLTLFGLDFGALVGGGALLTEVVFGIPGIGKLTYDALQALDLPMILADVVYASFFVVMANFVVDLLQILLDPRLRDAR